MPKLLNPALRNIIPKNVWGCRETFNNSSLQRFADNEYIATVGSKIISFDINANHDKVTNLVDSYDNDVLYVASMTLSADCKYLATLVIIKDTEENIGTAKFLIYNLENRFQGHSRPRVITYKETPVGHPNHLRNMKNLESPVAIEITCMAFSHDSHFFACGSTIKSSGLIIFDHFRGTVYQKISIESTVRHITFNPENNMKICTTGDLGLFKFWRFSDKAVHAAPVTGLKMGDFTYTYHAWIDESGVLIGGTNKGFLVIVQGCEQTAPIQYAFGNGSSVADAYGVNENTISTILVRGDIVCVVSVTNLFAVYEVRRGLATEKNKIAPFHSIVLLTRISLPNVDFILGLQWCLQDSLTSYLMMGISSTSVFQFELITETEIAVFSTGNVLNKNTDAVPVTPTVQGRRIGKSKMMEISTEKNIFTYHNGSINALSLACRNHSVITASYEDCSVRVWDYNDLSNFNSSFLIESFRGPNAADNPFHLDMHPSGLYAAFACEDDVREFAITDSSLDLMKKTSTKTSFVGPTGIPFNITQPVSLVKYSNGGQYLAVVTGKVAQVFHCYSKSFASGSMSGESSRIMILCDHIAPITDLAFVKDDTYIVTSATDGSVYGWKVGATTRDNEFVCKGVPATLVAISKSSVAGNTKECTVVACFENNYDQTSIAANAVFRKKESGKWLRKMNQSNGSAENLSAGDVAELMNTQSNALSGKTKHSPGSFGVFRRSSSAINSVSVDIAAALGISSENSSTADRGGSIPMMEAGNKAHAQIVGTNSKKQDSQFLAVWTNGKVNPTPRVIYISVPVKSIAMGETEGPDRIPLCILGLVDGRVLISELPFPLRSIDPISIGMQPSVVPSASVKNKRSFKFNKDKGLSTHSYMSQDSVASSDSTRSSIVSSPSFKVSTHSSSPTRGSPTKPGGGNSLPQMLMIPEHDGDDGATTGRITTASSPAHINFPQSSVSLAAGTATTASAMAELLDETLCREFRMHVGAVMQVGISSDGMWLFSAGADGVFFMYACSRNSKELSVIPQMSDVAEDRFLMIDRAKIHALRTTLKEAELALEILKKDNEISLHKVTASKDKIIAELEDRMKKEVKERDDIIVKERSELQALKLQKRDELSKVKNECDEEINRIEVEYERKLTHEAIYLEKMRQAYDEYVVHSKLDLQDVQSKNDRMIQDIEADKATALREAEKQKTMLLQYFDYVKLRNNEILIGLEDKQEDERYRLKEELKTAKKALEDAYAQNLTDQAKFNRKTHNLVMDIEGKDLEVLKQKNDILWAHERISKLETALQKATQDLKLREEMSEKWESKTGELQQKIIDLERIRKALTTQLHTLRQELGPKEESLVKASEKLQEMDREYEMSLHAISEKDNALTQKTMNLHLLQKQIRDLRMMVGRKDMIIRRAATIFEDYRIARQQAYFSSEKRTVTHPSNSNSNNNSSNNNNNNNSTATIQEIDENGIIVKEKTISKKIMKKAQSGSSLPAVSQSQGSGVVEIIAQNEEMKAAFKRLGDMLSPYLTEDHADTEVQDDIEAVRSEQERHMKQLHNTVSRVRSSLDLVNVVSEKKLVNYLSDNQTLLAEVNNLRTEVRNLSMENQKLMAQMEFTNSIRSSKKSNILNEEESSLHESISSCSDGEGDGQDNSRHKMVREMTRAQLIREKSRRKRQKSIDNNRGRSSADNSRHSRRPSMDNLSAIDEPPYDSDGNSQSPAVLTTAAAIAAAEVNEWNSVPAKLTDPVIEVGYNSRHISPRVQIPRPAAINTGGKSLSSSLPYSGRHSHSNQSSRHLLDSPIPLAPGAEVLPNQRQKLDEHMKKYSNYAKEKGSGDVRLTSDQKIAALISMNEKEIQSMKVRTSVGDSKKMIASDLASVGSFSQGKSNRVLGTAVIELPKMFQKK